MKNKYSSRKIIIPCFVLIFIFAIGTSTYFFNRLQNIFQTRQNQEAFAHIEDYVTTAAENTRMNFYRNWQTVEAISIFCESYTGTDFVKLKTFLHDKKYDWNILRITLCTENGMMYNEMGEVVSRGKLKNYLGALKDLKKVYSQDGIFLDYLQYVDSKILINGSKLVGVSTSIDINSVLFFDDSKQFDSQGYMCLIDNNGSKIAEAYNENFNLPGNLFSYLKECDVINVNKESISISQSLQESKIFMGIMENYHTNENHYFVCYPIVPREKYEPTRCHLLFMVPDEVVSRNELNEIPLQRGCDDRAVVAVGGVLHVPRREAHQLAHLAVVLLAEEIQNGVQCLCVGTDRLVKIVAGSLLGVAGQIEEEAAVHDQIVMAVQLVPIGRTTFGGFINGIALNG